MERRLVNIQHACKIAGVSRRTIYLWMSAGKIKYVRTAGGGARILEDTLFKSDPVPVEDATALKDIDLGPLVDGLEPIPHKDIALCHVGFPGGQDRCSRCQRIIAAWATVRALQNLQEA